MLYFVYFCLYFLVFFFGCCVGSFLNVLIYRIPKRIPFWKGRSYCPACDAVIKPYDLIPLFSYFFLRGKCRNCNHKISNRYPLVESLTGLIALFIFREYDLSIEFILCFIFSALLITIALIDSDTLTISNELVISLLIPTAVSLVIHPDWLSRAIGFFAVSLPMLILTLIIPESFGGGDIKLIAICGLMLGYQNILLAGFIALLLGGAYGVILLIKSKDNRKKHFAFGPFLCVGILTAMLYGEWIINQYLQLFHLN